MRTAQTILSVIQERGKQKLPLERVYKLLYNRELYLLAYAKLYSNNGAMTKGVTDETVDSMSLKKIDISLRHCEMKDINGQRLKEYISRRKTENKDRWACQHGAISCYKRLSV